MKIRNGFVSNSSSSSFILETREDIDEAKKHNMHIYKVSDLIEKLSPIYKIIQKLNHFNFLDDFDDEVPYFLYEDIEYIHFNTTYYDELKKLYNLNKDVCITSPFDRDIAYDLNLKFQIFESDL